MSKGPFPNEFVHQVACKCVLGSSFTDDMIKVAVNLMELGYDHPGLLDIAIERPGVQPNWPVQPRLEAVLRDLDMWPTRKDAIEGIARSALKPVLAKPGASISDIGGLTGIYDELHETPELAELVYALDESEWMNQAQRDWLLEQFRAFSNEEPLPETPFPESNLSLSQRLRAWFLRWL